MKKERFWTVCCLFFALYGTGCNDDGNSHESEINRMPLVSQWNELGLTAVRAGSARPTITTRSMFLLSVAMYDAWTAYDALALPYMLDPSLKRPENEHTEKNKKRAVSQAAYIVLSDQFPEFEADTHVFSDHLIQLGYPVNPEPDLQTPEGIGMMAGMTILEGRKNDGSNWQNGYADTTSGTYPSLYVPLNSPDPKKPNAVNGALFNPNHWTPLRVPNGKLVDENGIPMVDNDDPGSFTDQEFLTPHWGHVKPFALISGNQFRPQPPPRRGSSEPYTDALGNIMTHDEAWRRQFDQVLEFSANLTDEQKVMAEFWADGPRTESPPGHWNQLAHGVVERDRLGIDEEVKLYFALNAGLLDAGIAAWEAKRHYDFIRPAPAIANEYHDQYILAWGGPDQGARMILGQDWRPYQDPTFVTPPFPEYVSGHSTFSSAAAEILTLFTGSPQFYDGTTTTVQDVNFDGEPDLLGQYIALAGSNKFEASPAQDVILRWWTFEDAAMEAGLSRIYGGIHIQDGNLFGFEMGKKIGLQAFNEAFAYWTGTIDAGQQ